MKLILTLIILLSTSLAHASVPDLWDTTPQADILLSESISQLHYVAQAGDKVYVVHTNADFLGQEHYYLSYLKEGTLKEIGSIDVLIGESEEKNTFDVLGTTQYDDEYYKVVGMVQFQGEIYIAKRTKLYKLVDNTLELFPLSLYGKDFDPSKHDQVFEVFTAAENNMYIGLKEKKVYQTADSTSIFKTPLSQLLLRIREDGVAEPTYTWLPQHFSNINPNFGVNEEKGFVVFPQSLFGNWHAVHILGDGKAPIALHGAELGSIYSVDSRYDNVMIYNGDILADRQIFSRGRRDATAVMKVTTGKYAPFRNNPVFRGAFQSTRTPVMILSHNRHLLHWTEGEDGYVYVVGKYTDSSFSIQKFKY